MPRFHPFAVRRWRRCAVHCDCSWPRVTFHEVTFPGRRKSPPRFLLRYGDTCCCSGIGFHLQEEGCFAPGLAAAPVPAATYHLYLNVIRGSCGRRVAGGVAGVSYAILIIVANAAG